MLDCRAACAAASREGCAAFTLTKVIEGTDAYPRPSPHPHLIFTLTLTFTLTFTLTLTLTLP